MDVSQINMWAILVAAISRFALGGIWYGPLFEKAWMKESGMTEEKMKSGNMLKIFGLSFVASLIISIILAFFLGSQLSIAMGAVYGLLIGFGWVSMCLATNDLFEQRSFKLFAINAGYHTLSFTIMGAIIAAWQ
ncbi:MAG: hypothetical protein COB79_02010 [Zetaproteobacteria bacterium]|nr:MAG: hypothetical protein COB79_02010 [Zetaproteobacteria bacterium]